MAFKSSTRTPTQKLGLDGRTVRRVGARVPVDGGVATRMPADVVLVGVVSIQGLPQLLRSGLAARAEGGRLWVCYEKNGGVARRQIGERAEVLGLTWFRQVALSAGWSAIWFKRRSEFKTLNR